MKYLSEYVAEGQTKAMDKAGAFFAFGDKQFNEAMAKDKERSDYCHVFSGLYSPKDTAKQLMEDLADVHKAGIAQDIADNGLEKIILRELNNHEAYYTRDITSTVEALEPYDITAEQVEKLFHNKNHKLN